MSDRLLRRREVEKETGLPRSTLYRHIKAGIFPRPRRLGPNCVGWRSSDIEHWKAGLPPAGPEPAR